MRLKYLYIALLFVYSGLVSQNSLFSNVSVSDVGSNNNIGQANTSRNVAVDGSGNIYVVFAGSQGTRVAKSINRGRSFLPSVLISSYSGEPEIAVNWEGLIYVAWVQGNNIKLSISSDQGNSFSSERTIGFATPSVIAIESIETVHIATHENHIYISDRSGTNIYVNSNNGIGSFSRIRLPTFAYSDILTDLNGNVYAPRDDPSLDLFRSVDNGKNFNQRGLFPSNDVFFSSYTLSDGPCGTYIFVAGSGSIGYKIDVTSGTSTEIVFGSNDLTSHARTLFADSQGTIIDGYQNFKGELVMSISFNQGDTFNPPIVIADGTSHNIARNTKYNDIVVAYSANGQVYLSVFDDVLKRINIVDPYPSIELCGSEEFELTFELDGSFSPNTDFSVVLSDSSGSFNNRTIIDNITTDTSSTLTVYLPSGLLPSDNYRLLIESIADCTQSEPISLLLDIFDFNEPQDLFVCEDIDPVATFNLEQNSNIIQPDDKAYKISYYVSESEAINAIDPIANISNYSSENATIWVRIVDEEADDCFIISSFEISVLKIPTINDSILLEQCDTDFDGITDFNLLDSIGSIPDSEDFDYSFFTSLADAEIGLESSAIINPDIFTNTAAFNQRIYMKIEQKNNPAPYCFKVNTIDLRVNTIPEIDIADAYVLCLDKYDERLPISFNTVLPNLPIETQLNDTDYTFQWYDGSREDVTDDPLSYLISAETTYSYSPTKAGDYSVLITDKSTGCLVILSTEVFSSYPPESISIEQINNFFSGNNTLRVSVEGSGEYEYLIDNGNWQTSPVFENLSAGEHSISVRDIYNCDILETSKTIVDYPLFFTPNNDGFNDYWNIINIDKLSNVKILIFDRYGKLLKELLPSEIGWDGTYRGKLMPTSDYWFTITYINPIDGIKRNFSANFTLKR